MDSYVFEGAKSGREETTVLPAGWLGILMKPKSGCPEKYRYREKLIKPTIRLAMTHVITTNQAG